MAINNADAIKSYSAGVVFEKRLPIEESFSIDGSGTRTIAWTFTLITTQEAEKFDVAAHEAYTEILEPFEIEGFPFYVDSITLSRVDHQYGVRQSRAGNAMVPVARWTVNASYRTRQNASREGLTDSLKPSEVNPVITWNTQTFDMATAADVFNRPYQNTAGDYFEGVSRPAEERVYSVTLNEAVPGVTVNSGGKPKSYRTIANEVAALEASGTNYEPLYTNLMNFTNSLPVTIRGLLWGVNTLRVTSMSLGEIKIDKSEVYYEVNFQLAGRYWGWQREVANRGSNELRYYFPRGSLLADAFPAPVFPKKDRYFTPYGPFAGDVLNDLNEHVHVKGFAPSPHSGLAGVPGDGPGGYYSMEQLMTCGAVAVEKVPITDLKGRPLANPVFLDGYGEAQFSNSALPGFVGSLTVQRGSRTATANFNLYEYLGQRVTTANGYTFYIPETAEQLLAVQLSREVNYSNAKQDYAAKFTTVMPLIMCKGPHDSTLVPQVNEHDELSGVYFIPSENSQVLVVLTPGIKLSFQDYRLADLSALPGVYLAS